MSTQLPPPPTPPPLPTEPEGIRRPEPFRDAGPFGMLTIVLLIVDMVVALGVIGLLHSETGLSRRALSGDLIAAQRADHNDTNIRALQAAEGIAFAMTGVAWLVWVQRAHTNLDTLRSENLRFTHGWAVGWLVMPVASFVMAPKVMSELLRASKEPGSAWRQRKTPAIIVAWWTVYLVSTGLRYFYLFRRGRAELFELSGIDRGLIIGNASYIVAGILALLIVARIVTSQQARAAELGLG